MTIVTEGVGRAEVAKRVELAIVPEGVVFVVAAKRVGVTVDAYSVGTTVVSEETVIIKSLFIVTYVHLNNIRISVIRYVQRHIRKRSS